MATKKRTKKKARVKSKLRPRKNTRKARKPARTLRNILPFVDGLAYAAGSQAISSALSALKPKKKRNKAKPRKGNPAQGNAAVQVKHGGRNVVFAGPAGMIRNLTQGLKKAFGNNKVVTGKMVRREA